LNGGEMDAGTSIIIGTGAAVFATIVGTAIIVLMQRPKQYVDNNEHWMVMSMEAPAEQLTPLATSQMKRPHGIAP